MDQGPNYWGFDEKFPQNRLPYVDEINAVIMTDMAARLAALRSGKIDVLGTAGDSQIRSIDQLKSLQEKNPEINMWTFEFRAGTGFIFNNVNNPPFNDVRVRRAMQMALDLETINETFFSGFGNPTPNGVMANSKMGVGTPFEEWPEEIKPYYRYDPEGAKQLLAEAGYPDGLKTRLDYDIRADMSYAELVANYWREIGAEVAIHTVDATQSTALWKDNTSDGMLGSVSAITYEPRNGIGRFTTGHVWNGTAGSDAEIDESLGTRQHGCHARGVQSVGQSGESALAGTAVDDYWSTEPTVQRRAAVGQGLQRRGQSVQEWPLFYRHDPGLDRPGYEAGDGLLKPRANGRPA